MSPLFVYGFADVLEVTVNVSFGNPYVGGYVSCRPRAGFESGKNGVSHGIRGFGRFDGRGRHFNLLFHNLLRALSILLKCNTMHHHVVAFEREKWTS